MAIARITLSSGRDFELVGLEVFSTYGGMLEGYPHAALNDRLLDSLAKRRESPYGTPPVHVIRPPRTHPHPEPRSGSFGPVETLPAVYCRGSFRSARIDEELDPVLHQSWLAVVWFQDDLNDPVVDFVAAAIADLPWDALAEDDEL
ncbi:hypothetical protein [Actinomadura sp. 21ATH]|uniref:hypothetical protein n=1 Tax=Actinomadura sp. 21ATH TaxID=1735444 RepID=UPI0035C0D10A